MGDMTVISSLAEQAKALDASLDHWNTWTLVALGATAVAALLLVITTRFALTRAKDLAEVQRQLLASDLKDKDVEIAKAKKSAAEATDRAEAERLARLELERQLAPRRLTGPQRDLITKILSARKDAVAIVSTVLDGEGSDLADDLDAAIKAAHWETLRIRNHISDRRGLRLGTVAGTTLAGTAELAHALHASGVQYESASFTAGDATTSPPFQTGVIYLVVERKPEPKSSGIDAGSPAASGK
jgi:hypothetical protein